MAEYGDARGRSARPRRDAEARTKRTAKKSTKKLVGGAKRTLRQAAAKHRYAGMIIKGSDSVDKLVVHVRHATPLEMVEIERRGVKGGLVKELAKRLDIPAVRVFGMLRLPKATIAKKSSTDAMVSGRGGHAAVAMAKLLGIAEDILANSTAKEAKNVDAAKWLGQWLERPQPSLGGRAPGALLDTPTGVAIVSRLLGAIESGAYQ
jgi:putative toxin-antitoxin system antitoxin component (TIGR02293 family)